MSEVYESSSIPNGIGPHEFRELDLMLAGVKPLAMFFDVMPPTIVLPESDFEPHVKSGRIVKREEIYLQSESGKLPLRYLYYALAGEEKRIDSLHCINREIIIERRQAHSDDHILIGQLLGYEKWEIDTFIDWIKKKPLPDKKINIKGE